MLKRNKTCKFLLDVLRHLIHIRIHKYFLQRWLKNFQCSFRSKNILYCNCPTINFHNLITLTWIDGLYANWTFQKIHNICFNIVHFFIWYLNIIWFPVSSLQIVHFSKGIFVYSIELNIKVYYEILMFQKAIQTVFISFAYSTLHFDKFF